MDNRGGLKFKVLVKVSAAIDNIIEFVTINKFMIKEVKMFGFVLLFDF